MKIDVFLKQAFYWSISLVVITLPMPKYSLSSASLILCVILWLLQGSLIDKWALLLERWRDFILLSSLFLLALVGLLYTQNMEQGMRNIEQSLPFIVIPLLFCTTRLDSQDRTVILKHFSYAVIVAGLFAMSKALYFFVFNLGELLFFDQFALLTEKHTTYFALFTVVAIAYFVFEDKRSNRLTRSLSILFLIFQLYVVSTRMSIIAVIAILLLACWQRRYKISKTQLMAVLFVSALPALLFLSPNFQKRINSQTPEGISISDTGARIIHWQAVINSANETNFLFGAGTGDGHSGLYDAYLDIGYETGYVRKYNAHNQYLEMVLFYGVIGVFVFALLLYFLVSKALQHRDYFFIAVLITFGLFMITESVLERQSGIFLFAFLNGMLVFVGTDNINNLKGIGVIGPYPPPVGGISLFMKKISSLLLETFSDNVDIIDEFGHSLPEITYSLSRTSKINYVVRLLFFIIVKNNNDIIYYNGAQALTRFILVCFSKLLGFKIILHLHGRSAINFSKRGKIQRIITHITFSNADRVLSVNAVISQDLKKLNPDWKIIDLPAYIASPAVAPTETINTFFENLPENKEFFVTYATLDKTRSGNYNYGILDICSFFKRTELRSDNIGLILILILDTVKDYIEYETEIEPFLHDNIHVFINPGTEPLTPFFDKALGYIRWTYEDGWAGSLAEAQSFNIRVIASNVSERTLASELFNPHDPESLLLTIQKPPTEKLKEHIDYAISYIDFFKSIGCTLKPIEK